MWGVVLVSLVGLGRGCEFSGTVHTLSCDCRHHPDSIHSLGQLNQTIVSLANHLELECQSGLVSLEETELSPAFAHLRSIRVSESGLAVVSPLFFRHPDLGQLQEVLLTDNAELDQLSWQSVVKTGMPLQKFGLTGGSLNCSQCSAQWLATPPSLRRTTLTKLPQGGEVWASEWERAGLPERVESECAESDALPPHCRPLQPRLALLFNGRREPTLAVGQQVTVRCEAELGAGHSVSLSLCLTQAPTFLTTIHPRARRCIPPHHLEGRVKEEENAVTLRIARVSLKHNVWVHCAPAPDSLTPLPVSLTRALVVHGMPEIASMEHVDGGNDTSARHYIFLNVLAYPPPTFNWTRISHDGRESGLQTGLHWVSTSDDPFAFGLLQKRLAFQRLYHLGGEYQVRVCNELGCANHSVLVPSTVAPPQLRLPPYQEEGRKREWWLLLGCLCLLVFLSLCFVAVLIRIRHHRAHKHTADPFRALSLVSNHGETIPLECFTKNVNDNENYSGNSDWVLSLPAHVPVVCLAELELLRELGEGAFGKVFLAHTNSTLYSGLPSRVAAKSLKVSQKDRLGCLRQEAGHLAKLAHPHIVSFLGVCVGETEQNLFLLFEYMEQGDLRKWLQERGPHAGLLPRNCFTNHTTTTTLSSFAPTSPGFQENVAGRPGNEELVNICWQLAQGLAYLAQHHFVHRDLAARNCLVHPPSLPHLLRLLLTHPSLPSIATTTLTSTVFEVAEGPLVKISDFGMSRDIYCEDYYRIEGNRMLPVRWMATEGFLYGRFGTPADVWSLGVVMWEVFSLGKQPWYGLANHEVLERVKEGGTLEPPKEAPDSVKELMKDTWKFEAAYRPTPDQIVIRLAKILADISLGAKAIDSQISDDSGLSAQLL